MAIIPSILSNLPLEGGYYVIEGNGTQTVEILVQNTGPVAVYVKQVYLQEQFTNVSLGLPDFRYISSYINTTNNLIPAGGSQTYQAYFIPQVPALTEYPTSVYSFSLFAQVMLVTNTTIPAPAIQFKVYPAKRIGNQIISPFAVWNRTVNKRSPQYEGFDFYLGAQEILENGLVIPIPMNELYWTSILPGVLDVVQHSDAIEVQGSGIINPRLLPSGGSAIVFPSANEGRADIEVRRYSMMDPIIAKTNIQVINRAPITLELDAYNPVVNVFPSTYRFIAYALFDNGTRVNVSSSAIFKVDGVLDNGVAYVTNVGLQGGKIFITNDNLSLSVFNTNTIVIDVRWTDPNSGITVATSTNLFVRST
jgi:hypothetical protein